MVATLRSPVATGANTTLSSSSTPAAVTKRFASFRYSSVSFACIICASVTWLLRKRACGFASPMGSEIAPFGHA